MRIERWGIVLGLACAVLFWIIDSFIDAAFYFEGSFWQLALTDVPLHELYIRLAVGGLLVLFGLAMSALLRNVRLSRDELGRSREHLFTTLRSIGDAVIATDSDGRITFLNPVAVELTGWGADEAVGQPCSTVFNIVNEQTDEPAENPVERVLKEGVIVGLANHTALISRDGTRRPIDDSGAPIRDSRGNVTGAVLVFHDISERKAAEERIGHLNSVLLAIRNVNQLITQENDPGELARQSCELLIETRGYYAAWIGLMDDNGAPPIVHGTGADSNGLERLLSQIREERLPGCWRRAEKAEGTVITTNPERQCPDCCMAGCFNDAGSMSLRLRHGGQDYGYLSVTMPVKHVNDPDEIALFEEVAGDIAFALHDIELQRRHQEAADRLQHSVNNMLEGWAILEVMEDESGSPSDFRIRRVNPAAEKMLEIDVERHVGGIASEVFPRSRTTGLLSSLTRVVETGRPYRVEAYEMEVGGRQVLIDLTGFKIDDHYIGCTFSDVTERFEFQQQLQDERDKAQRYLDVVGVMVVALDDAGRVALVNDRVCEVLDVSEDEIVGADWFGTYIPGDQAEDVKAAFKKLLAGETDVAEYFENDVLTRNGDRRLIAWHNTLLRDENGRITGTLSAGEDVTEKRAVQAALIESEERYRGLYEGSRDGIVMIDLEGRFLECNQAFADMVGYSLRELRELNFLEITPEKWHEWEWREIVQKQLLGRGYTDTYEKEYRHKDGTIFPVELRSYRLEDSKGNPVALWGVARDISERKQVEAAVRESEEKFSKAFHTSPYAITITRARDSRFIDVNEAFTTISGYTRAEALADSSIGLRLWVNDEDRKKVISDARQGKTVAGREFQFRRKNGEILTGLFSAQIITLQDEPCVLSSISDITERKQAEQELREAWLRQDAAINAGNVGLWDWDLRTDEVSYSAEWKAQIGYEDDEIANGFDEWKSRVHPDDVDSTLKKVQDSIAEGRGSWEVEFRFRHKDGSYRWILAQASVLKDESGRPVRALGSHVDITDQKIAQQRLAESEARFRMLYNSVHAGVVLHASDGEIIHANDVACEILRMSKDDITGRTSTDTIWNMILEDGTPIPGEEHPAMITLRTGRPIHQAVRGLVDEESGEMQWLLINTEPLMDPVTGEVREVMATFSDITELKLAQAELTNERERLGITLRSIGDGVIATDAEGRITMINEVASDLTGFDEESAIGRPLEEVFRIINENTRETVENPVHKVMRTGRIVGLANSTLLVNRDGRELVIADSGAPIRDETNQIVGVVLVFRDVTEKRRMQDFTVRAQRLETAGRIAGQVAHDFNNLLAPLMAYPPFIREAVPDNVEVSDYIDKIEKAAEQMAEINQQLLTLGRRGHYAVENLDLNDVVRHVIRQFQPAPETLNFDISLASDLMPVRGGSSQLYRVIANLVTNATDAMQGVGRLTIRTENYYLDESAGRYGHIPKGEYVKLSVIDTGSGIPHVILNKIFEPFFTTKTSDRRRGSGLGLSVVHSVVEDHGGHVDFDSTMGKGTEFYIYLPVSRESMPSADASEQITGGNELILVVDDDWTQRDVTVTLLEKLGYRASSAESGEKAVELLKDRPHDLIILDMIMPGGMDGAETFEHIRQLYPDQKAVIVSGYAENDRVRRALDLGCGAFVRKPITLKSVALAVRRELDRAPIDMPTGGRDDKRKS